MIVLKVVTNDCSNATLLYKFIRAISFI